MLTLCPRTTSASSTAVHSETRCCEPHPAHPVSTLAALQYHTGFCLQTSMIPSAWSRPFLPKTARVRALDVPTITSPFRVFNLAALHTPRITRHVFDNSLFLFERLSTIRHVSGSGFCLASNVSAAALPDPPRPPPSCLVGCLLTWDLLPSLCSMLRRPHFPRRSPIVAAELKSHGEPCPRSWGCNPR